MQRLKSVGAFPSHMARSETDSTTEASNDYNHRPGTVARLAPESEIVCIVDTPDATAGDYEIDELAGRTVAEANADNPQVSPEDDVVEVVFPSSVNYYAESLTRLDGWTPSSLAGMQVAGSLEETPVTVYAYPASLIEPTPANVGSQETSPVSA